jgi:hypothetical protein
MTAMQTVLTKRRRTLLVLGALASAVVIAPLACGGGGASPPPAGDARVAEGGAATDSSAHDGDLDSGLVFHPPDAADGAITCPVPALGGATINGRSVSGGPPSDTGGTITPGTYDLTDLEVYGQLSGEDDGGVDAGTPTDQAQATFTISASMLQLSRTASPPGNVGAPIVTMLVAQQHVSDVFLVLDNTCPNTDSVQIPFTATATKVTLHSAMLRREVYTLRP